MNSVINKPSGSLKRRFINEKKPISLMMISVYRNITAHDDDLCLSKHVADLFIAI